MLRSFQDFLRMGIGADPSLQQQPEQYSPQANQSQHNDEGAILQLFMRSLGLGDKQNQNMGSDYSQNYGYTPQGQSLPQQGNPTNFSSNGQRLTTDGSDLTPLMMALRKKESGGNYSTTNSIGYSGGYQFGPQALEQVGLLKPGASKYGAVGMRDPANWTIPGGRDAFMSDPQIQDNAMRRLIDNNRRALTNMGLINESTPESVVNGMLAAAHLSGPGGVRKLLHGRDSSDAGGASASSYYKLGSSL